MSAPVAYAPVAPAFRDFHRIALTLLESFAAIALAAGVDDLPADELSYEKSYLAGFAYDAIRARCSQERELIICEAQKFIEQRQRQATTHLVRRRS